MSGCNCGADDEAKRDFDGDEERRCAAPLCKCDRAEKRGDSVESERYAESPARAGTGTAAVAAANAAAARLRKRLEVEVENVGGTSQHHGGSP